MNKLVLVFVVVSLLHQVLSQYPHPKPQSRIVESESEKRTANVQTFFITWSGTTWGNPQCIAYAIAQIDISQVPTGSFSSVSFGALKFFQLNFTTSSATRSFSLSSYDSWYFNSEIGLDFTKELIGQTANGYTFGTCNENSDPCGCGDFNVFPINYDTTPWGEICLTLQDGESYTSQRTTISSFKPAVSAVCGNGIVESGEQCDGGSCCTSTCTFQSSSTVCRSSAGACDIAEHCTGSSSLCPADSFQSTSTVCRAQSGPCDNAASCTGSSASCPANSFQSASTVCGTQTGPCDIAATCSGSSASCPANSFQSSSTVCGTQTGPCDIAATCSGSSASCPANSFQSSSTVCGTQTGPCDIAATCSGSSASCPANSFDSSSTVCRPAVNSCDFAEFCTGTSSSCPPDVVSETTPCFCGRQNLSDGEVGFYCDATGGFYECLGGALSVLSVDMNCALGTACGCAFGVECSCGMEWSPCVLAGTQQWCPI